MAGQFLFHLALIQPLIRMVARLGWKPQEGISQVSDGLVLLVGLPHSKEDEGSQTSHLEAGLEEGRSSMFQSSSLGLRSPRTQSTTSPTFCWSKQVTRLP